MNSCIQPSISLVAWKDRQAGFIFVAIPGERGRYLRTKKPVALAACPHCESVTGEPCKSGHGPWGPNDRWYYTGGTHCDRHIAAGMKTGSYSFADDVIKPHYKLTPERIRRWMNGDWETEAQP